MTTRDHTPETASLQPSRREALGIGAAAGIGVLALPHAAAAASPIAAGGSDSELTGAVFLVGSGGSPKYASIQAAIDAAQAGDSIVIDAGTYTENITVDKRLTITSNLVSGQIGVTILPANAATAIVSITASGQDSSNRLTLRNLKLSTGSGDGIRLNRSDGTWEHYRFENVTVINNTGSGLAFIGASVNTIYRDIAVVGCRFETNGRGILFDSPLTVDTVLVDDSVFVGNTTQGIRTNLGSAPATSFVGTNFTISNSTFTNNGGSSGGQGALILMGYRGNASLSNLTFSATGSATALTVSGDAGRDVPIGEVSITNLTANGTYANDVMQVTGYQDLSNLTLSGLNLTSATPGTTGHSFFGNYSRWSHLVLSNFTGNLSATTATTVSALPSQVTLAMQSESGSTLASGAGNAILIARAGTNVLTGGAGNDVFIATGTGTTTMTGGAGSNTFVIEDAPFGSKTITDFKTPATPTDKIDLRWYTGARTGISGGLQYGNLTRTQSGSDTVITAIDPAYGSITVQSVVPDALTADYFMFPTS